jgi:hypothetical protein
VFAPVRESRSATMSLCTYYTNWFVFTLRLPPGGVNVVQALAISSGGGRGRASSTMPAATSVTVAVMVNEVV